MVLWLLLLYHGGASILILTNQKNGFLTVIVETRFSILEEFLPSPPKNDRESVLEFHRFFFSIPEK